MTAEVRMENVLRELGMELQEKNGVSHLPVLEQETKFIESVVEKKPCLQE